MSSPAVHSNRDGSLAHGRGTLRSLSTGPTSFAVRQQRQEKQQSSEQLPSSASRVLSCAASATTRCDLAPFRPPACASASPPSGNMALYSRSCVAERASDSIGLTCRRCACEPTTATLELVVAQARSSVKGCFVLCILQHIQSVVSAAKTKSSLLQTGTMYSVQPYAIILTLKQAAARRANKLTQSSTLPARPGTSPRVLGARSSSLSTRNGSQLPRATGVSGARTGTKHPVAA